MTDSKKASPPKARPTPRRGSALKAVPVEAGSKEMLMLMTEQSDNGKGISTYYSGSRPRFAALGIPNDLFPAGKKPVSFRLDPGGACWFGGEVDAHITRTDSGFDLEIQWGYQGPYKCAHPALQAIAHHMVRQLWSLTDFYRVEQDGKVPLETLAKAQPYYDFIVERPVAFSPAFDEHLLRSVHPAVWHGILKGEILPLAPPRTAIAEAESDGQFQRVLGSITGSEPHPPQ